ncbi:MAG: hypothetical protein MI919_35190, partial [Holophagales bacterium]|nr:hypothetical protein [Holophagales bacterium]
MPHPTRPGSLRATLLETPAASSGEAVPWTGLPLFVQDRERRRWALAGLVHGPEPGSGPNVLEAVSLPALLEAEGFRDALLLPGRKERCGAYLGELCRRLESSDAAERIAAARPEWGEAFGGARKTEALARSLTLETDFLPLAEALVSAFLEAQREGEPEAARQVYGVLEVAAPAAFLRDLEDEPPDRSAGLVRTEIGLPALVDLLMAAIDGGSTGYPEPVGQGDGRPPPSVYRLEELARIEVDPGGEAAVDRIVRDLEERRLFELGSDPEEEARILRSIARLATGRPVAHQPPVFDEDEVEQLFPEEGSSPEGAGLDLLAELDEAMERGFDNRRRLYLTRADPARAGLHEKERFERLRRLLPGLRQVVTESASRESGRWQRQR